MFPLASLVPHLCEEGAVWQAAPGLFRLIMIKRLHGILFFFLIKKKGGGDELDCVNSNKTSEHKKPILLASVYTEP